MHVPYRNYGGIGKCRAEPLARPTRNMLASLNCRGPLLRPKDKISRAAQQQACP
jgi:hypothetical protein